MSKDISSALPHASSSFLLRMDPRLHSDVRARAAQADLSMNEYCVRSLAGAPFVPEPDLLRVIRGVHAAAGGRLLGILAYGSWARGEAASASDIDLLAVVERDLPITRALYRPLDDSRLTWEGYEVSVHFVHLPEDGARITGTWAEAATDGLILFDPALHLGRVLAAVRRRIVAGELRRRTVHGQPYWMEAA
jgi:predicted nucleotidyltransferase